MADWSNPTISSTYTNFVTEVKRRDTDLLLGMDPATIDPDPTNVPTNAIRWSSAANKWQKYNGSTWGDLSSAYAISISGTASGLSATLAVGSGGTNLTSYTVGDLLYASGASALSKLAGVATGNALISGGVSTAPSWGKITLTGHVSGTLPVANGGTGGTTGADARSGIGAAKSGANSDITSLAGLTTALSVAQGGTGAATLTANSVLLGNGTSALQAVAPGTAGNVLTSNGTTWASGGTPSAFRNRLINGGFNVWQYVGATAGDNAYIKNRYLFVGEDNTCASVTDGSTDVPDGAVNSAKITVHNHYKLNNKFGLMQFVENAHCKDMLGSTVTFSFYAKVNSVAEGHLTNIKAGILAWTGTADDISSTDPISAWGADGITPTLKTNLTFENTPANLSVTTSWARYSITATLDTANTTNVGIFLWSDVKSTTLNDALTIANLQLEVGSTASAFEYRPYALELALCQRYCYTLAHGAIDGYYGVGIYSTTTQVVAMIAFPCELLKVPKLITTGSAGDYSIGGTVCTSAPTLSSRSTKNLGCAFFTSTGVTVSSGHATSARAVTAISFLRFEAEI